MSEIINREATPIEKVAVALQALTYGEMLEVGARIRAILGDRISDGADMQDSRTVADVLHSWAESELLDAETGPDV